MEEKESPLETVNAIIMSCLKYRALQPFRLTFENLKKEIIRDDESWKPFPERREK